MENSDKIIIDEKCFLCETHLTELGTLKEIEKVVKENFSQWNKDKQEDLIINWFIQTKMDERMYYIEKSKQKTTDKIQQFKKQNIQAVKKI